VSTNELGHRLASAHEGQMTLGAYRRGNRTPWVPGAQIDVWVPCARGDVATGVPYPHVYFVQTLGERSSESGSIHCPTCRAELAARRASGPIAAPPPRPPRPSAPSSPAATAATAVPQAALPF